MIMLSLQFLAQMILILQGGVLYWSQGAVAIKSICPCLNVGPESNGISVLTFECELYTISILSLMYNIFLIENVL